MGSKVGSYTGLLKAGVKQTGAQWDSSLRGSQAPLSTWPWGPGECRLELRHGFTKLCHCSSALISFSQKRKVHLKLGASDCVWKECAYACECMCVYACVCMCM